MKERPILFSAPMVRAILAGRKTQTRRMGEIWEHVKAGDRLWVRETWCPVRHGEYTPLPLGRKVLGAWDAYPHYRADVQGNGKHENDGYWRPSIFMPRWASRILLEATEDARREPLADISEADAIAEGIQRQALPDLVGNHYHWGDPTKDRCKTAAEAVRSLWDSINGKSSPVSSNPFPVRLAFRRIA